MTWLDEDERHSAPPLPVRHSSSVTVPLRVAPLHLEKSWEPRKQVMSVSSSHHIQDCSSVPHDGGVVELISEECILLILSFLFENLSSHLLVFTFPPPTHHSALMISESFFFPPSGLWSEGFLGGGVSCWLSVEGICIYVHHICAYMGMIWCHQHLSSPESLGPHPRGCVAGLPTGLVLSVVLSSLRPSSLFDLSKNGLL